MVKLYLDAGHGGKDPGAAGNGIKEKDIVLDICNRIEAGLKEYEDVEVITTRTTDVFLSLDARTKKANQNNCDVLLSIHSNSATDATAKGWEIHVYPGSNAGTVALQNVMHSEVMKVLGSSTANRGKKQSNFHMLRESKMKAVLTENLFVSNPSDAALLEKADFRQKIAQGHINGLEKFLGLKKSAQPPPTAPTNPSGKYWIVQVGAFEEKSNAEAMYNDLRKSGYRPIIKYE